MNQLNHYFIVLANLLALLFFVPAASADRSAVRLDLPAQAPAGSDISITVHVTHEGNNYFHFTDWVSLKADEEEIGRWAFTASQRPEDENFSKTLTYKLHETTQFTAQANCNVHGSAGPSKATVYVVSKKQANNPPEVKQSVRENTSLPTEQGRSLLSWMVLILGVINFLLIFFQVLTGRRWIRVSIAVHRRTGQIVLLTAIIHGGLALLIYF